MAPYQATAEVFLTAFKALPAKERSTFLTKLLKDNSLREDILGIAMLLIIIASGLVSIVSFIPSMTGHIWSKFWIQVTAKTYITKLVVVLVVQASANHDGIVFSVGATSTIFHAVFPLTTLFYVIHYVYT